MKKKVLGFFLFVFAMNARSQNIGFGTTTPGARVEIVGASSNSTTSAFIIKNSINDTLLRVRTSGQFNFGYNGPTTGRRINVGGTGMNFFTGGEVFGGAILPTDTSLILWSQSEENNYVILQPSWGKVGIGTYSPKAKLDVNGSFKLGLKGSPLNSIIKDSILTNIPTIAANASFTLTPTIDEAKAGASVMVSPEDALPDGLVIAYARVSSPNTVEIKFTNVSSLSVNPSTMKFYITVIQ